MSFISGPYTVTYDGATIGQLFEGLTFSVVHHKEIITGDNLARAAQDAVYQGTDMTSDFTLSEWDQAKAILLYNPYGATWLVTSVVGRVDYQQSLVKSLVLTAVAGTPAATAANSATVTLPQTIIHEEFPVSHIFRPQHRRVPVRVRHYPEINASTLAATYGTAT